MGSILAACVTASEDASKEERVTVPSLTNWVRLGGEELEQPLRDGLVKCVDSRYLVNLFRSGGRIERMQDLPNNAFIGLDDLKGLGTYKTQIFEASFTTYEWLPIIILSYSWLGRSHPDPHGETLEVLVKALERMEPHGVIIDFTSLPQALERMEPHGVIIDFTSLPQVPRTDEENTRFKDGLQLFNIFYSHAHTLVLQEPQVMAIAMAGGHGHGVSISSECQCQCLRCQVTKFPAGYPSTRSYDLPEGHAPVEYQHRGWCFAEACISSLGKSPKLLCNLSRLPENPEGIVGKCMNEHTPPPRPPSVFNEELSAKAFTQKRTDLARVQKLYEDAFNSRILNAESLEFANVRWGPAEIHKFAEVIEVNRQVRHLDLSRNRVGKEGMMVLSRVIELQPALTSLKLVACELRDAGTSVLGEALRVNATVTVLEIGDNKITAEGARSLAEAVRVNTTLSTLDLTDNALGDQGARSLSEALRVNLALTALDLRLNEIGDEGAGSLAEALMSNTVLTVLNLRYNKIKAEGARSLAEALRVKSALKTLELGNNEIDDDGARSLAEAKAARPNCNTDW